MRELGITAEIDESGHYQSVRARLSTLDRATRAREMRKLGAAPDYIIGSAHAVTDAGEIIVGSGSGSQLGAYAFAGGHVILVIGHQSSSATSTKASAACANTACRESTHACKALAAQAACSPRHSSSTASRPPGSASAGREPLGSHAVECPVFAAGATPVDQELTVIRRLSAVHAGCAEPDRPARAE